MEQENNTLNNQQENKIYIWTGSGHFLGATVIVVCNTMKLATKLIKKELNDCRLLDSIVKEDKIEVIDIANKKTIYVNDGDY